MSEGKDRTQRRVYVLPTELVERIVAYQQNLGLSSEVEAARRLLDEALMQRDTVETITTKFYDKFLEVKSLREAARDVLTHHPLITEITFDDFGLRYRLKNGCTVNIDRLGKATVWDYNDNIYDLGYAPLPEWASDRHPRTAPPTAGGSKPNYDLDDDIPF